mgnify:CR=1 FL=1
MKYLDDHEEIQKSMSSIKCYITWSRRLSLISLIGFSITGLIWTFFTKNFFFFQKLNFSFKIWRSFKKLNFFIEILAKNWNSIQKLNFFNRSLAPKLKFYLKIDFFIKNRNFLKKNRNLGLKLNLFSKILILWKIVLLMVWSTGFCKTGLVSKNSLFRPDFGNKSDKIQNSKFIAIITHTPRTEGRVF